MAETKCSCRTTYPVDSRPDGEEMRLTILTKTAEVAMLQARIKELEYKIESLGGKL